MRFELTDTSAPVHHGRVPSRGVTPSQADHFERELLQRLLWTAQRTIERVRLQFEAGLVADLAGTLGVELNSHGINDLSAEWIHEVARMIVAGEPVDLPSAEDLEHETSHRSPST